MKLYTGKQKHREKPLFKYKSKPNTCIKKIMDHFHIRFDHIFPFYKQANNLSCCDTAKPHLAERHEAADREALLQAVSCRLCTALLVLSDKSLLLPPSPALHPQCHEQQADSGQSSPCHRTARAAPTGTPQHHSHGLDPTWHLCPRSPLRNSAVCACLQPAGSK